ncbi:MAG: hypothetical protein K0U68_00855 [Gammaproteobacteria bacterium]|nr:hypothetical protein [Gammaproteobacteria bacterium]
MTTIQGHVKKFVICMSFILTVSTSFQSNANDLSRFITHPSMLSDSIDLNSFIPVLTAESKLELPSQQSNSSPAKTLLSSEDNLTYIILGLAVLGLAILLFIPGKYIRKPINLDQDPSETDPENSQTRSNSTFNSTTDTFDSYIESMDAEDELEQQLDAEEKLAVFETKAEGKIKTRDSKHQNRINKRRKR